MLPQNLLGKANPKGPPEEVGDVHEEVGPRVGQVDGGECEEGEGDEAVGQEECDPDPAHHGGHLGQDWIGHPPLHLLALVPNGRELPLDHRDGDELVEECDVVAEVEAVPDGEED